MPLRLPLNIPRLVHTTRGSGFLLCLDVFSCRHWNSVNQSQKFRLITDSCSFHRRKFGSTVDLVRVADTVVKLASRCEICGKPALFTFRKTLDIQTTIIGGADVYMPVCRQHYVGGQLVVDSACTVLEAHQAAHSRKDC